MRSLAILALFSMAAIPFAAHATTLDQLSVTGTDAGGIPYSIDFALDPAIPSGNEFNFSYTGVVGTVSGVSDIFDVTISQYKGTDFLEIDDSSSLFAEFDFAPNGTTAFLSGSPDAGATPTITPGSYAGGVTCDASLHMPSAAVPGSPALAMFQVPGLSLFCGEAVNLSVTNGTPTSVTPEPSALALFATGALGVAGVIRRRSLA